MPALRIAVEVLTVEKGLWCRTCALPAGRRIWYVSQTGPAMSLRTHTCCRDGGCDHDVDTAVDPDDDRD